MAINQLLTWEPLLVVVFVHVMTVAIRRFLPNAFLNHRITKASWFVVTAIASTLLTVYVAHPAVLSANVAALWMFGILIGLGHSLAYRWICKVFPQVKMLDDLLTDRLS